MLLERLRTTLHKEINLTTTPERISITIACIILFSVPGTFSRKVKQICRILSSTVSINTYTQGRKKQSVILTKKDSQKTHIFPTGSKGYTALVPMAFSHDSMELDGGFLFFFGIPKKQHETSKLRYPNGSKWYQFRTAVLVICQLSESFYVGGQSFWVISLLKYQPRYLSG